MEGNHRKHIGSNALIFKQLKPLRGAMVSAIIGIIFLTVGIALGDLYTVLAKATMICLECIGLG